MNVSITPVVTKPLAGFLFVLLAVVPVASSEESTWARLLNCGICRSVDCQEFLRAVSEGEGEPAEQALARRLLLDQTLDPGNKELATALPVQLQSPDYAALLAELATKKLQSPIVVVSGVADPSGAVRDVKLRVSSGSSDADQLCLQALEVARYRPARDESGYIASPVGLTCHLYLQ